MITVLACTVAIATTGAINEHLPYSARCKTPTLKLVDLQGTSTSGPETSFSEHAPEIVRLLGRMPDEYLNDFILDVESARDEDALLTLLSDWDATLDVENDPELAEALVEGRKGPFEFVVG